MTLGVLAESRAEGVHALACLSFVLLEGAQAVVCLLGRQLAKLLRVGASEARAVHAPRTAPPEHPPRELGSRALVVGQELGQLVKERTPRHAELPGKGRDGNAALEAGAQANTARSRETLASSAASSRFQRATRRTS